MTFCYVSSWQPDLPEGLVAILETFFDRALEGSPNCYVRYRELLQEGEWILYLPIL